MGAPTLSSMFADALKANGEFTRAYKYYFKARDEVNVIACMKEGIKQGYQSEQDLFVCRAVLDMMVRSPDFSKAKAIRNAFAKL